MKNDLSLPIAHEPCDTMHANKPNTPCRAFLKTKTSPTKIQAPIVEIKSPTNEKNAKLVEVCSLAPFPAPRTPALDADEANNPFCFCEYFVENTSEEEEEYKLWRRS